MKHTSWEYFSIILNYINDYRDEFGSSPTFRKMEEDLGIPKASLSLYINRMKDEGLLEMSGHRNIVPKSDDCAMTRVIFNGKVCCGDGKDADSEAKKYVRLPVSIFGRGNYYILEADGDSMTDAGIDDGDMIVVESASSAENNDIVVVHLGDNITKLRRFRKENADKSIILHPENKNYDDEKFNPESMQIQGVLRYIIKKAG